MLSRLGLAYAINMHQAQGMTTDRGIGVMHSAERHLSSQRLAHVLVTRVRDDLTIFTNGRDQLLRTISANPGDKTSAIETVNEQQSRKSAQGKREDRHQQPVQRDPFAVDPLSMRAGRLQATIAPKAPERDVPEIDLELGL